MTNKLAKINIYLLIHSGWLSTKQKDARLLFCWKHSRSRHKVPLSKWSITKERTQKTMIWLNAIFSPFSRRLFFYIITENMTCHVLFQPKSRTSFISRTDPLCNFLLVSFYTFSVFIQRRKEWYEGWLDMLRTENCFGAKNRTNGKFPQMDFLVWRILLRFLSDKNLSLIILISEPSSAVKHEIRFRGLVSLRHMSVDQKHVRGESKRVLCKTWEHPLHSSVIHSFAQFRLIRFDGWNACDTQAVL